VGEGKKILLLPEGASVADAFVALKNSYPDFEAALMGKGLRNPADRVLYSLFVNARPVPLDQAASTPLHDGDRIYLFLPVAGG
jgi:molybdopterin converting factor small subunit